MSGRLADTRFLKEFINGYFEQCIASARLAFSSRMRGPRIGSEDA